MPRYVFRVTGEVVVEAENIILAVEAANRSDRRHSRDAARMVDGTSFMSRGYQRGRDWIHDSVRGNGPAEIKFVRKD